LLFSTDVSLLVKTIYRYYKAHFQIEFLASIMALAIPAASAQSKNP